MSRGAEGCRSPSSPKGIGARVPSSTPSSTPTPRSPFTALGSSAQPAASTSSGIVLGPGYNISMMLCACTVDGLREVAARRLMVMRQLGVARPADLTSAVIMSLAFDFGADAAILPDGIEVTTTQRAISVLCDLPLDGLCHAWAVLSAETHDGHRGAGTAADAVVVETAMAVRLEALADAQTTDRAHRRAAHGGSYVDSCAECRRGLTAWGVMARALDLAWGAAALDAAVERALTRQW